MRTRRPKITTMNAITIVAAFAFAVFGVIRLVASFTTPVEAAPDANIDGLATLVTDASWAKMDENMNAPRDQNGPGYQMPPQMMPGSPTDGKDRLQLTVNVTNTTDQTRLFLAGEEFALYAGKDGQRWELYGDTFGDLPRLAPRNAVKGILYFDLPAAEVLDTPMWLQWTHDGTTTRLTVPINGAAAPPSHTGEHR